MTNEQLKRRVARLIKRFQNALNLQGWKITSNVVRQSTMRRDYDGEHVTADVTYSRQKLEAHVRVPSNYFDDHDYSSGHVTEHEFLSEIIAHEMLHIWLSEHRLRIKHARPPYLDKEEKFCDAMGMILARNLRRRKT